MKGRKMAQKNIYCSACGQAIQIDGERQSCFCPQCGNKILLQEQEKIRRNKKEELVQCENNRNYINKKLEEAEFYYQLSREKAEAQKYSQEPFYYLKAQDLLLDLAEQYPDDYRIWWLLCKPIDFENPLAGLEVYKQYCIQETYFNRALDQAELADKRRLVEAHDKYLSAKNQAQIAFDKRQREAEERQRVLEEVKRIEEEKEKQIWKKTEEERKKRGLEESQSLWMELYEKNYAGVDGAFFSFSIENSQTIICIFREVSKVLYLSAFRQDGNRNNSISIEQALAVQFDQQGYCLKYDNSPVRMKDWLYPDNLLWIMRDGVGGLSISNLELKFDKEYVAHIQRVAKKSLIMGRKIMY